EANSDRHCGPRSSASTRCTVAAGSAGAASCSLVSVARYGPASSGGNAASKIDSAWPSFIAPPLSSPRTRKIWSAVRCWISCATISGGRPPIRLPTPPRADPPPAPDGRAARQPDGQPGHLGGPGHRVLGHVVHTDIVPHG